MKIAGEIFGVSSIWPEKCVFLGLDWTEIVRLPRR